MTRYYRSIRTDKQSYMTCYDMSYRIFMIWKTFLYDESYRTYSAWFEHLQYSYITYHIGTLWPTKNFLYDISYWNVPIWQYSYMTCHDMSYRIKNTYKKGPICMSYGKVGVLYDVTYRKYRPPVKWVRKRKS